jgi:TRAP transporter TAXI family solute receptor
MNAILSRRLSVLLALTGTCVACAPAPRASAPVLVRLATGQKGDTYFQVGQAVASFYNTSLPGVSAQVVTTGGSPTNVEAIENGTADLGLATSDTVYRAFVEGTKESSRPHTHLRGMAVLFPTVLHVFVRQDSSIQTLSDLRGRRIGVIAPDRVVPAVLEARIAAILGAVSLSRETHTIVLSRVEDEMASLGRGDIDVALLFPVYPYQPITLLAESYGIRLLEIDRPTRSLIRASHPFFKHAVIPARTYPGQDRDIETIALDNLLICRDDLPNDVVYRLTRALYEGLQRLGADHQVLKQINALKQINVEDGPATPLPLHKGAARYYRERELWR